MEFDQRIIGNKYMKKMVYEALTLLPSDITNFITRNCWFVGSYEDGWAFVFRGADLKKTDYLIFLSDDLLNAGESQIIYTILHEVGHVLLKHRNSIGIVQTKSEIKKQEKEADEFANFYLKK